MDEPRRLGIGQGTEKDRLDDAEKRGVGADPKGERDDCDEGKAGGFRELAKRVARVGLDGHGGRPRVTQTRCQGVTAPGYFTGCSELDRAARLCNPRLLSKMKQRFPANGTRGFFGLRRLGAAFAR